MSKYIERLTLSKLFDTQTQVIRLNNLARAAKAASHVVVISSERMMELDDDEYEAVNTAYKHALRALVDLESEASKLSVSKVNEKVGEYPSLFSKAELL